MAEAVQRGEIWWADLPPPTGSGPGFRRPLVVIQSDSLNRSNLASVIGVAVTATTRLASAPGNVLLLATETGLPDDSVANVSQIVTLDRRRLTRRVGRLDASSMAEVDDGLRLALDLW